MSQPSERKRASDLTDGDRSPRKPPSRLQAEVPLPNWLDKAMKFLDRCQRTIPLTREGKFWTLFALALLATGLFRSINLINLLACFMLAALLHNLWSARRQLR